MISLEVVHRLTGHEEAVTAIIMMKQRKELLATASLDKCIRLWDTSVDPPRCCHTLGPPKVGWAPHGRHVPDAENESETLRCHERGVTCLAFSAQHRHLFSGGLDHEVLVWNPLSERVICNLRMHTAPLAAIEAVQRTPMVVSADCTGVHGIWDCRSLSCTQKLVVSIPQGVELTGMAVIPQHHQIVSVARRLSCFQGPEQPDANLTDTLPIACGLYNEKSRSFCTASGTNVTIWDAASGTVKSKYTDVTPTPITAMCFDDRERKLLVADHSGKIIVLNYQNGAVMKPMIGHTAEVSSMLYVPSRRHVLSTSWDRQVVLQDESPPDDGKLIKAMHAGHCCDVTTAAYSHAHALYATGGDDGGLQIWRLDERGVPHPHYELQGHTGCITALCFLEPWPLLASADSTGTVRIWSTKFAPHLSKLSYKQLLLMRNQASSGLWLMKELRAAKVQINARNTDGTLSDAQLKEAINREIRQSDIGTSRALVGSSNSVIVGGGAIRPDSAEPTSPEGARRRHHHRRRRPI